jgi:hypothetical protein
MIENFYEITKTEINDCENQIMSKDREMEVMEDNHRIEIRVYVQKVKHLEYEHKNNLKKVQMEAKEIILEEEELQQEREKNLKNTKNSLQIELKERELSNEEEIEQMKQAHEKNLSKLKEQFEKNMFSLEEKCHLRLKELQEGLELRRKVNIHEIEERKNLHLNDLMKNHEKAFTQIKNYYNDITKDNLKLIDSLKNEILLMKKKQQANTKLMYEISQENKRLSEPLTAAIQEVEHLRHELKDEQKDQLSLRNAKLRLVHLTEQLNELVQKQQELKNNLKIIENDRNLLYDTFEQTIQTIQKKGACKNLILEQRVAKMEDQFDIKQIHLKEIIQAAKIDPKKAKQISMSIDILLQQKNTHLKELEFTLAKASKTYNDSLRTFQEKMIHFGIPEEEILSMGFQTLQFTNINSNPAGLVAI